MPNPNKQTDMGTAYAYCWDSVSRILSLVFCGTSLIGQPASQPAASQPTSQPAASQPTGLQAGTALTRELQCSQAAFSKVVTQVKWPRQLGRTDANILIFPSVFSGKITTSISQVTQQHLIRNLGPTRSKLGLQGLSAR